MEILLLGPIEVRDAEARLHGLRPRALLAALALASGRTVTDARLLRVGWPHGEPRASVLQPHISRLRAALGAAAAIERSAGGYRLTIAPDRIDADRFRRLAAEGRAALQRGDVPAAMRLLDRALTLWRGPALGDLPPEVAARCRAGTRRGPAGTRQRARRAVSHRSATAHSSDQRRT